MREQQMEEAPSMGRPMLTERERRERVALVERVESLRARRPDLTWKQCCARRGVPFYSFNRWRRELAQE